MPAKISKIQRWLDLLSFLMGRRFPVSVGEIMEGVPAYAERWRTAEKTARATAQRTFERDKDELRRFGIPIETVEHTVHYGSERTVGYRLSRRDFYLPYLKLLSGRPTRSAGKSGTAVPEIEIGPEEARDAIDALKLLSELESQPHASAARSALRKLAFDLEPAGISPAPVVIRDPSATAETAERLAFLTEALQSRRRVGFRYHAMRHDTTSDREVQPYGLLFQGGHWYLVGHDSGRDGRRLFRVDRMTAPRLAGAGDAPEYEIPPDFHLEDYLRREAWELGEGEADVIATVRFDQVLALWAERNRFGSEARVLDDGAVEREFPVRQEDAFLRWVLTLESGAELVGPADLRKRFSELAEAVAGRYRDVGGNEDRDA